MAHFDLCVIGTGSANSIVTHRFDHLRIALVESGRFGGTCLNVGCIPTKMFVYPADLAESPGPAAGLGVDLELGGVHWEAIRDRIFGRIDPNSERGRAWRERSGNITLIPEEAHFVGPRTLDVGSAGIVTADRFVIGAGGRPFIPDLPGLDSVRYHTSDTVMRLDRLPRSLVIIGGGYVAAEFAHIFAAYGTAVTLLNRSDLVLRHEDQEIAARFTDLLSRRVDVRLRTRVEGVRPDGAGVRVEVVGPDETRSSVTGEILLLATGRMPNGDRLNLGAAGVDVDNDGYIVVDDQQRTTAADVFAMGDVSSHHRLKHVANHEARVVRHNLLNPDAMISSDRRFIPHAVFSQPQVASVGITEAEARSAKLCFVIGRESYSEIAYGWAMEDTEHFAKIIADARSGQILGAHLIGPQASSLIQPVIQAMSFGLTARQTARGQYWIHPAMAEVVENALLKAAPYR